MDKRIIALFIVLTIFAPPVGALPNTNVGIGANASIFEGWAPLKVHFYSWSNDTTITKWIWDFGDGTHRYGKIVNHTYKDGTYKATVKAKTKSGAIVFTKSFTITSYKASFTATQINKRSNNVKFHYTGDGKPTFLWKFGDRSISNVQDPTHRYKKDGKYTVSLTVKNSTGSKTVTKKIIVK
jgi:PKD repeat protein